MSGVPKAPNAIDFSGAEPIPNGHDPRPVARLDLAQKHIELLTGDMDTPCCFRLIRKSDGAARKLTGPIHKLWADIEVAQRIGFDAYIIVNEGGHDGPSITRIRALFADADNLPMPKTWHVRPSFVTQRDATHWHAYWLVTGMALTDFTSAQKRLAAHYGTDPAVHDLPRVMRLAGSYHQKDPAHPFLVKIAADAPVLRYSAAAVLDGLLEIAEEAKSTTSAPTGEPVSLDIVRDMLAVLDPGCDRNRWRDIGAAIHAAPVPGDYDESGRRGLFHDWSAGAPDLYDEAETDKVFDTMPPIEGGIHFGTLVKLARDAGYTGSSSIRGSTYEDPAQYTDGQDDGGPTCLNTEKTDNQQVPGDWVSYGAAGMPEPPPPVAEIIPGMVEKHIMTYEEGPGGLGKSYIVQQESVCVAAGYPVLGQPVEQTGVLYLNYEEPKQEFDRRLYRIINYYGTERLPDGRTFHDWKEGLPRNPSTVRADMGTFREAGAVLRPLDISRFAMRHLRHATGAHILRVTRAGGIILTRFGGQFLDKLAERRDQGRHSCVVFDGLIDAIIFEGSTRSEDDVARQLIALLDRWCHEYDFTGRGIFHPSRTGERTDTSSYAPAWDTKPRALNRYRLVDGAGKSITGIAVSTTPEQERFTRRTAAKRSHGAFGAHVDMQYRDGVFQTRGGIVGGENAVDVAVDIAGRYDGDGCRIKRDGTIGTEGVHLSNKHVIIVEYRGRTGKPYGVPHFLGSLDTAEGEGRLGYEKGRSKTPAGYAMAY
jgi:hypothetical protein